jgi:hypothetical protein
VQRLADLVLPVDDARHSFVPLHRAMAALGGRVIDVRVLKRRLQLRLARQLQMQRCTSVKACAEAHAQE